MATTYTITSVEVANKSYQRHVINNGSGGNETEVVQIDHLVTPSFGHYETYIRHVSLKTTSALSYDVWLNDGTATYFLFEGTSQAGVYEMLLPNAVSVENGGIQKIVLLEGCTLDINVVNVPNTEQVVVTVSTESYMSEEIIPCL